MNKKLIIGILILILIIIVGLIYYNDINNADYSANNMFFLAPIF